MSRRRNINESAAEKRIRAAVGDVTRIAREFLTDSAQAPRFPTPTWHFNIDDWMDDFDAFSKTQQHKEQEVKTARNAKQKQRQPNQPTMTSHAQFKRDEELFPRLRIHRKHRAVVWFGCREGGLVVHAGAQDSPFVFSQVVDVGGRLKYGDFDDYVGTIVLSNT